jgi:uncharacterized protein YndB with AHSA1/START domain
MMTTRTLVIERDMAYPPEKIWRALTEGRLIQEWLMENDLQPVVGHRFQFRSTPVPGWNGVIDCEVMVVEAGRKLAYSWGTMGTETLVTWTLAATSEGTRVRMEQSGFGEDQEAAYKGANYGWQRFIGKMEQVVAGLR